MKKPTRMQIVWTLAKWAAEEGKELPISAGRIADIELAGGIVDLETGEILYLKPTETKPDASPQL